MIVKIIPEDKYSLFYKKETLAAHVGIGMIVAGGVVLPLLGTTPGMFRMMYLGAGIFSAIWVHAIAEDQNREPLWLSIAAFLFPVFMLIVMGYSRKMNLVFSIDNSYSEEDKYYSLKGYADKFVEKGKVEEAEIVYRYIISNLLHDEEDEVLYSKLLNKLTHV